MHVEDFDFHVTAGIGLTGKAYISIGSDGIQPYGLHSSLLRQILHASHNTDSTFPALRPSPTHRYDGDCIPLKGDEYGCYQVCFHPVAAV